MSRFRRTRGLIVAGALVITGAAVMSQTTGATNIGDQGCTPGYWKNHTQNWEEYAPTTKLGSVFAIPASLSAYQNQTMLQGLQLKGGPGVDGGAQILLRAATASFLNAAHEGVGFPYRRFTDPGNLSSRVNAALASGDRAAMIALAAELDAANNLGCPLN